MQYGEEVDLSYKEHGAMSCKRCENNNYFT